MANPKHTSLKGALLLSVAAILLCATTAVAQSVTHNCRPASVIPRTGKEPPAKVVIDPYNDFISEGGKVWDRLEGIAEAHKCVPHMLQVLNAARKVELRVFYALHRRYRPGDYETAEAVVEVDSF